MPKEKRFKLEDYGISDYMQDELRAFCRQYDEKRLQLDSIRGLTGIQYDGMPRATTTGDPTASKAERAEQLQREIEMIEQAAIAAEPELYPWILKSVTQDRVPGGYYSVYPPCCKNLFYEARKRFFVELAKRKKYI